MFCLGVGCHRAELLGPGAPPLSEVELSNSVEFDCGGRLCFRECTHQLNECQLHPVFSQFVTIPHAIVWGGGVIL